METNIVVIRKCASFLFSPKRINSQGHRRGLHIRRSRLCLEQMEERCLLASIDLGSITPVQGRTLYGVDAFDLSGSALNSAGDLNGDGYDDFIVGAFLSDGEGNLKRNAGESYVIFGSPSLPTTIDLSTVGTPSGPPGFLILGSETTDLSGRSVSSAGDVNGDGFDDLLLGAYQADAAGNLKAEAGEAYLIFGSSSFPSVIQLANLGTPSGTPGVVLHGTDPGDLTGFSVSGAGDVNGDGLDDMIVGAYHADGFNNDKLDAGANYVIFGSATLPPTIALGSVGLTGGVAGFTIHGARPGDRSGQSLSHAGDINGDGFDDLLIGASTADGAGSAHESAGNSYLIFGGLSFPATIELSALGTSSGVAGVVFNGVDAGDRSGMSIRGAGDLNGDGFDDVVIGAFLADGPGNSQGSTGESYVVFGSTTLSATINLNSLGTPNNPAGILFYGAEAGDFAGRAVSGVGDVNGDGFDDLLIGASRADGLGNTKADAGESYLIFGDVSFPALIDLNLIGSPGNSLGLIIYGVEAGDQSGAVVNEAGDVNGDGFDDLLIGAYWGDSIGNAKSSAGDSYILFGSDFKSTITHSGTFTAETLTGTIANDLMIGDRSNDTVIGNGGMDVLIGGQGNDLLAISDVNFRRLVGGSGNDTLRLDGSGLILNLTTLKDNRLLGIESIDITGSGNNTLLLSYREVLNISDETNTLIVKRNIGDIVDFGSGWTQLANQTIGGNVFNVFTQGLAKLFVELNLATPMVSIAVSNKAYDGQPIQATPSITGNALPTPPLFVRYYSDAAGLNVISTPKNVGTYFARAISAANGFNNNAESVLLSFQITPISLTISAIGQNKIYDATTTATVTLFDNRIAGDVFTVAVLATFIDKNVGNSKPISLSNVLLTGQDAGNYIISSASSSAANITHRGIEILVAVSDKVYDGTVNATIESTTLIGVLPGDVVSDVGGTAEFSDKHVGTEKVVNATGFFLGGPDSGNYFIDAENVGLANISRKSITVTATVSDKVYDATTNADVTISLAGTIPGDDISGMAVGSFDDKNVANEKPVTIGTITFAGSDFDNYTIENLPGSDALADIYPQPITGSITAANKTYDGTRNATILARTLTGVFGTDDVHYVGGTATFDTADIGNDKTVTAIELSLSGDDAGNYTVNPIAETTANILAAGSVVNTQLFYRAIGTNATIGNAINPTTRIDPSKLALQPGQTEASIEAAPGGTANFIKYYSGFIAGINGLVVDIANTVGVPTAHDFQFRTWNGISGSPATSFTLTSATPTVTNLGLVGQGGSRRMKIEFLDNAIKNTWLQVTVLANPATTGLSAPSIFYFGNAAGDAGVGNSQSIATGNLWQVTVTGTDGSAVLANQTAPGGALISNNFDVGKNFSVSGTDRTQLLSQPQGLVLRFFNAPSPPAASMMSTGALNSSSLAPVISLPTVISKQNSLIDQFYENLEEDSFIDSFTGYE